MRPTKQQKTQLQIALLGMDERSCKIMSMFFKGPCEGHAVIVEEGQANVAIIDTRFEHAREILEQSIAQGKMRAIIVLSSQSVDRIIHNKVMYLNKPITANPMFEALDWAKDLSEGKHREKPASAHVQPIPAIPQVQAASPERHVAATKEAPSLLVQIQNNKPPIEGSSEESINEPDILIQPAEKPEEAHYTAKVPPAEPESTPFVPIQMDESEFAEVIGTVVDVDLDDPSKQRTATYDPDKYYQGCIQRAFNKAREQNEVLQLTLGWNPLVILPESKQIWWDADDKLLKAVSDIEININTAVATPIDPNEIDETSITPDKRQDMDTFLWKLTLWSSRGRYPLTIDIDSPIHLKRWPNFTRYIVTPHALRITALLIKEGPDTMIGIANALNIELRYVSIFVSATHALGLIRQIPSPKIDEVLMPASRKKPDQQTRSILSKILTKLLGR